LNIPINADQWLNNRQQTAFTETKLPLTQKRYFPHCSTMPKTIDGTQNLYPNKTQSFHLIRACPKSRHSLIRDFLIHATVVTIPSQKTMLKPAAKTNSHN